jgi:hypothetical protein
MLVRTSRGRKKKKIHWLDLSCKWVYVIANGFLDLVQQLTMHGFVKA